MVKVHAYILCETKSLYSVQCIFSLLCRYEDMHEEIWCWKNNFGQIYKVKNLAIFLQLPIAGGSIVLPAANFLLKMIWWSKEAMIETNCYMYLFYVLRFAPKSRVKVSGLRRMTLNPDRILITYEPYELRRMTLNPDRILIMYEPYEKTFFLHMQNQRRRSAALCWAAALFSLLR